MTNVARDKAAARLEFDFVVRSRSYFFFSSAFLNLLSLRAARRLWQAEKHCRSRYVGSRMLQLVHLSKVDTSQGVTLILFLMQPTRITAITTTFLVGPCPKALGKALEVNGTV